jgi:hypothetical protein
VRTAPRLRVHAAVATAAILLACAPAAHASRPASDAERAAIAQLSGISPACLDIAVSTVDPAFAAYGFTGTPGCPDKGNMVGLQAGGAGFRVVAFLSGGEQCPLEGIATPVALDLKICREPPPATYLPLAGTLREQPAKVTLAKKGALSSLVWSSWGGGTAKAKGRFRAPGARKSSAVSVTLSSRITCSTGKRIYTKIKITPPRGVKVPFSKAGRIATCADAG